MAAPNASVTPKPRRPRVRANGEGSVFKVLRKDGTQAWRATRTAYTTNKGQVKVSGQGATREQAIERRERNWTKLQVQLALLPPEALASAAPSELKVTVEDWLYRWHQGLNPTEVSEQTRAQYLSRINLHLVPHIGDTPLRLLTDEKVLELLNTTLPAKRKVVSGKATDEPLLGSTAIRSIYFVLSAALDTAVKRRQVAENVCLKITAPKRSARKDERVDALKWTPQHLMRALEGSPDEARWLLAFYGLRQAEVLGLTDDCLRMSGKKGDATLIIKQQLARHHTQHGCGSPKDREYPCGERTSLTCPQRIGKPGLYIKPKTKTASSTRRLPIVEPLYSVLRAHMKAQRDIRESPSFSPVEGEGLDKLVFTSKTGKPRRHQDDSAAWRKLLKDNGVPPMRGHLARHITVSLLVQQGVVPDIVKQIVGHNDITMTSFYTHIGRSQATAPLEGLGTYLSARQSASKTAKSAAKDNGVLDTAEKIAAERKALEAMEAELLRRKAAVLVSESAMDTPNQ